MDSKDFAKMRKAEELEYAYRLPLYSTMELFIETLTGTCFELRVSPYETVISVKAKIQRLEGIPISQQYLIWQNIELEDDYCLHDYNITDGCTLKLVLAMRGGPINTRRIAMEDPTFSEMADYIDSREEFLEKLSPPPSGGNGSKQVTLLVYRDGDQLNFFRVVDRGDGTLTPFSESLSGSASNLREGDDENDEDDVSSGGAAKVRKSSSQQQLSVAQMVENNITAAKMKDLRSQMQNLHLNNSSNLKRKPQLTSINKTPSLLKLDAKSSRPKSSKTKAKLELEKPISETLERPYYGDTVAKSVDFSKCKTPIPPLPEIKDIEKSMSLPDVVKSPVKRAPLKRMKHVEHSEEISQEVQISSSEKFDAGDTKLDLTKVETENSEIPEVKSEVKQENKREKEEEESGRFSPRTRRLLNALESSSVQRRVTYPTQTTAYRSPRSSMLQGMTFNRHDMYLRSYGLIPSPDDVEEERVTSSISGETPPPVQTEDSSLPSKVLETSHGVKYSALPKTPYLGHGNRLLKSPPDWILPKDTVTQTEQSWHPQPPLTGSAVRNSERILRPPSSSRLATKTFHQKSYFDSMVGRTSKNFNLDKDNPPDEPFAPRQWQKLDSLRLPQPPSTSSTALAPPTWQKQRLRRLSNIKTNEMNMEPSSSALDNQSKDPLLNTRRSYGQNKSGLRMKESPHGKVESMSREEAREVVDFINKAVDASILRTLVRSPVKDGKRGSSGQNSHRLPAPTLQPSHLGMRGGSKLPPVPPTLPPVKPPTKKKRCFLCAKRTGLASSYVCRCGNNFCATHRYAESHNCTYDYKSSGRKLLEEANPLISAPKLPKI